MKVTTKAAPLRDPVAIVTGVVELEHKVAEVKVVLRGQFFNVVVLPEVQVTIFVNFWVLMVPEFLMKANWAPLTFASVIAAPVAAPPAVALGYILKVTVPTDSADTLLVRALFAAVAESSSVGAREMAPTAAAISVERTTPIAVNPYPSFRPSILRY